jgi:hypothetical protein
LGICTISLEAARATLKHQHNFEREFWSNETRPVPNIVSRWFWCAIAIATMPLAHFAGFGYQLCSIKIFGNQDNCFFESRSSIPRHNSAVKEKIKA